MWHANSTTTTTTTTTTHGGLTDGDSPSAWQLAVSAVVFGLVVALVVHPLRLTLRWPWRTRQQADAPAASLLLDFALAPWLGIVLLLAGTVATPLDIWQGLLGSADTLRPWTIVLFFFALAYLAVSLDQTGCLAAVAKWSAMHFGRSGFRLLVTVFSLAGFITILSSNDIVILTLTPIVCYVCSYSNIDPWPYLFAEFFASNLFSIILIIGNPTNVIACEATQMCSFLGYSARMLLPALGGGATALLALYAYFRHELPGALPPLDLHPGDAIANRADAAVTGTLGASCLLVMSLSSLLPSAIELWIVAAFFASICLGKDLVFDLLQLRHRRQQHDADHGVHIELRPMTDHHDNHEHHNDEHHNDEHHNDEHHNDEHHNDEHHNDEYHNDEYHNDEYHNDEYHNDEYHNDDQVPASDEFHCDTNVRTLSVLRQLPWKVLPFCTGMFVLVEIMDKVGWIDLFAGALSVLCADSLWLAVLVFGVGSTVACNLVNNQPMTIFFTRILLSPRLHLSPRPFAGALYALIIGSNFGADFTFIGALAGLMWCAILKQHNLDIHFFKFARIGLIVMTVPLLVALALLAAVLAILPP